mmetsp:Transcript_3911/g.6697  ORF Transcript_3911/g.6697 Transcript_3911/m.6697 type:complete len:81 (+) Transcript_3911:1682-1924(+)
MCSTSDIKSIFALSKAVQAWDQSNRKLIRFSEKEQEEEERGRNGNKHTLVDLVYVVDVAFLLCHGGWPTPHRPRTEEEER